MPIFKTERVPNVYVVEYTEEYAKNVLGVTDEEMSKYGLPMALKYEGCDVLIPVPSSRSTKSSMKKLVKEKSGDSPDKSKSELAEDVSTELASNYFK